MAARVLLAIFLSFAAAEEDVNNIDWKMGPPHGSNTTARCPVLGTAINITAKTPFVMFTKGQKLYFASEDAAAAYKKSPNDYWLGPHEAPEEGMDGMRGLPDVRGQLVNCPKSGMAINVSMQTPRVMQRHGQAVYFCCHGCLTGFWRNATSFFATE